MAWQNLLILDEGNPYWRFQELACEAIDTFLEKEGIRGRYRAAGARAAPAQWTR